MALASNLEQTPSFSRGYVSSMAKPIALTASERDGDRRKQRSILPAIRERLSRLRLIERRARRGATGLCAKANDGGGPSRAMKPAMMRIVGPMAQLLVTLIAVAKASSGGSTSGDAAGSKNRTGSTSNTGDRRELPAVRSRRDSS
jgi:hypothetical protein